MRLLVLDSESTPAVKPALARQERERIGEPLEKGVQEMQGVFRGPKAMSILPLNDRSTRKTRAQDGEDTVVVTFYLRLFNSYVWGGGKDFWG